MRRHTFLRIVALAALLPAFGWASEGWDQLKTGMTRYETAAVLGRELIASRSRGFEVAIYDGQAEVVFLKGQVVAWTAPGAAPATASPDDAWQFEQGTRTRSNTRASRATAEPRDRVPTRVTLPSYRL